MNDETYEDFKNLVNRDVRNETSDADRDWLRNDDNLIRFGKELRKLELTVTEQMEMGQRAVNAMQEGVRRQQEQKTVDGKNVSREFYRQRVRDRLAEIEDLAGSQPLVTYGQTVLYVEAVLDVLDEASERARGDVGTLVGKAVAMLERLLDAIDPPAEVA